ncbi:hypothetical protein SO802_021680 [Lithocarpus litseifolius]|uniref:Reverse transcriptase zinc-binding domain-containing protein n=1 Tax=Lithocarpus litseifolius TaxID=425828 RepID=A0AAW2CJW4_9ROSI
MGFRDIHAFNLAMLAKQAWRLTQDTHSLFYRVYKAKYFSSCSFIEAVLASNRSFVWRSLFSAREVIRVGSIWSIGDGGTASIKSHRWLLHPRTFHDGMDTSLKVREFIDPHTKQWDRGKVNDWFLPPSRDEVLGTRLGRLDGPDMLVWNENKSRTFSVLLAYQVALRIHWRSCAEHSRVWDDEWIWNKLWKLPIPPKKCDSSALNFLSLARSLVEKLSRKDLEMWAMVAWSIWNARNRAQFEATQTPPHAILKGAVLLLDEHQRLTRSVAPR